MGKTQVVLFKEEDGEIPFLQWFAGLPTKVQAKCLVRLERLKELGHELRRPEADYLRDEIYELRIRHQHVNYRILYFFHGKAAVVLSHGLEKEKQVPPKEIDTAVGRKDLFTSDPKTHTAELEQ